MQSTAEKDRVNDSLKALGFSHIPDAHTLRSTARRLLFTCHPDKHRGWPDAADRTREIIDAMRFLESRADEPQKTGRDGSARLYQTVQLGDERLAWPVAILAGFALEREAEYLSADHVEVRGKVYRLHRHRPSVKHRSACIAMFQNGSAVLLPALPGYPAMIRITPQEIVHAHDGDAVYRDGTAYRILGLGDSL